ncbi:hypothetical protein CRM22_009979 [Opisthorchis felineus]|nr:hypothetical protein CRM22_009979 [Opisthorchis felineus]
MTDSAKWHARQSTQCFVILDNVNGKTKYTVPIFELAEKLAVSVELPVLTPVELKRTTPTATMTTTISTITTAVVAERQ